MQGLLVVLIVTLFLAACHDDGKTRLQDYVTKVRVEPVQSITALPMFTMSQSISYSGMNHRSPFMQQEMYNINMSGVQRKKEPLERYALHTLKMVGTLTQNNCLWAIIATPDNTIHAVTIGNYMGLHLGRVIKVFTDKLQVVELLQEEANWIRHITYMKIVQ